MGKTKQVTVTVSGPENSGIYRLATEMSNELSSLGVETTLQGISWTPASHGNHRTDNQVAATVHASVLPKPQVWDAGRLSKTIPKGWETQSTISLWEEDDARPPDGETVSQAWARLFGVHPDSEEVLAKSDQGDSFGTLYTRGRILWTAVGGCCIEQIKFMPEVD